MYKTNENKYQHKFLYYNYNNRNIGSAADNSLLGNYWYELGSLHFGHLGDSASTEFL